MVTIERWRDLLLLDVETGHLFWRIKKSSRRSRAGSIHHGYRYVAYQNKRYAAHRIIWAMTHGTWPDQIDHINMVRDDNRPANLRDATISQNNRNRGRQSNNTSGFKGVTMHKGTGKFHAKIMANRVRKSLGYFRTAEEAAFAYQTAAKELHGEFSRN